MISTLHKAARPLFWALWILVAACSERNNAPESAYVSAPSESDPELRWKEEFDMLKNPTTGTIPKNIRALELAEAATIPLKEEMGLLAGNSYVFQGPNNLGGRTRALAYDVRYNGTSNRVVLAGGVSGGMFRSTDGGLSWTRVSSLNEIHSVTCVAQDPRPGFQNTWYFGTGEALGNSAGASGAASYFGYGIFKSTDNGLTWNPLSNTRPGSQFSFDSQFDFISNIAVNPQNGHVYAATSNCIMLSTNGGNNWTTDLGTFEGTSGGVTDVIITPDGIIYGSIPGRGLATAANQGVWKKEGGTWTRIAGGGTPAWFNSGNDLGRIALAFAPSSPNIVYALYFNGVTYTCTTPVPEAEFGRYDNTSGTWTDLSANLPDETGCLSGNDPFAVQGGYDLVVAVKPDNPNVVFIGGTNAYRSTDGFISTANTKRIGGYISPTSYGLYPGHHPDVHAFTFAPNNPNLMLCGTDGGIHEADISQTDVTWVERNVNYTTYQFYYGSIDPAAGSNFFIGGTQDNGTVYRNAGTNAHVQTMGGDGVSVGIANNNSNHYVGFQRGPVYRKLPTTANGFINATLTPPGLSSNRLFVTLFYLDPSNTTILYYADFNELHRNGRADTVPLNATEANRMEEVTGVAATIGSTSIRSFATSWGPYNAASSKLYFGTNDGRIFRLDDPRNCALNSTPVQINTGAGMPTGAVMGLSVNPRNADTVLAGIANYGVVSIWLCSNATSASPTWTPIEGNLTLPSVRSTAIVVNGATVEYYAGTSTGLYSTTILNGNATIWVKEGADVIGNAVVVDLDLRPSDNRLLVSTHGNGMFVTDVLLPVQMGNFKGMIVHGRTQLFWETLTETDNKGFDIEKSTDGRTFQKIGFVAGKGSSAQKTAYYFTDPAVLQRAQYYRLRQIDRDGRTTVSRVVKLTQEGMPLQLTSVINPMSTNLIFTLNDAPRKQVQVTLLDAGGRTVMRQGMSGNSGNVFRLNTHHLPNGIYTLWIQTEGLQVTRRVIKQG